MPSRHSYAIFLLSKSHSGVLSNQRITPPFQRTIFFRPSNSLSDTVPSCLLTFLPPGLTIKICIPGLQASCWMSARAFFPPWPSGNTKESCALIITVPSRGGMTMTSPCSLAPWGAGVWGRTRQRWDSFLLLLSGGVPDRWRTSALLQVREGTCDGDQRCTSPTVPQQLGFC